MNAEEAFKALRANAEAVRRLGVTRAEYVRRLAEARSGPDASSVFPALSPSKNTSND